MAGATRKSKFSKYEVTLTREVEYTAVIEVEARTSEEAKETALSVADAADANHWREGDITNYTSKVKVIRG